MNRFSKFSAQAIFTTFLSLSATGIYAEVSLKGIGNSNSDIKSAVPEQEQMPKQLEKADAAIWELHAEQWELARSGESILSLPVLKQVVNAWLSDKHRLIEIQYPGGEDGEFWVHELADWLVSLGVPSNVMVTTPGSGADDVIKFNLIKKM